jgi:hypothetical protein
MESMDSVLQASAARFLIDGGEEDAASVLLSYELECGDSGDSWFQGDETIWAVHIKLIGPRAAYEVLNCSGHAVTKAIRKALEAVIPSDRYIKHLTAHAELIEIDPDWRTELLEIARGRGVHNQGDHTRSVASWKNLNFRSKSEVRIAQTLDKERVLFMPNCTARVTSAEGRLNREPDFLVCADGKWGILEVDGEPFHPPSRTVHDHERDRLFKAHGIRIVEHYDASECFQRPEDVVREFLNLLRRS